jgi:tetratricopeptide (TPR) repeat protein
MAKVGWTVLAALALLMGSSLCAPAQAEPKADPKQEACEHFDRGMAALDKRDHELALREFSEVIRLFPTSAQAYASRGGTYLEKQDYRQAIADYGRAIRINPKDSSFYANRGLAYTAMQDYKQAVADFSKAIQLAPDAECYHCRGLAHVALKDYERAIEDFTQTLRLNPRHAFAHYNRATAHADQRDYRRAREDYQEAVRRQPETPHNYFALAWVLATSPDSGVRDGRYAREVARKGCQLAQWQVPGGFAALAAACAEVGDFTEAVRWQQRVLESPASLPKPQREKMQRCLELYRQGKPYREPDKH